MIRLKTSRRPNINAMKGIAQNDLCSLYVCTFSGVGRSLKHVAPIYYNTICVTSQHCCRNISIPRIAARLELTSSVSEGITNIKQGLTSNVYLFLYWKYSTTLLCGLGSVVHGHVSCCNATGRRLAYLAPLLFPLVCVWVTFRKHLLPLLWALFWNWVT